MQLAKQPDTPIDTEARDSLKEPSKRVAPPGQWIILAIAAVIGTGMVFYGIATKVGLFGLGQNAAPPAQAKGTDAYAPPAAPKLNVPMLPPAEASACPDGSRLPPGMPCPAVAGMPRDTSQPTGRNVQAAPGQPTADGGPSNGTAAASTGPANHVPTAAEKIASRRLDGDLGFAGTPDPQAPQSSDAAPAPRSAYGGFDPDDAIRKITAATAANRVNGSAPGTNQSPAGAAPSGPNTALGAQLVATDTPAAFARLKVNPSMTLGKGSMADCTLLTAIRTSVPGFIRCVLAEPIYSMDGKVVLMEAGTTINGEYNQGMRHGQRAIFTVWTEAVTPSFVTLNLMSPGTDALGRAGIDGYVDNKWLERYGGAVLYSIFDDGLEYKLAKAQQNAGTSVNLYQNTTSTGKTIVEDMLKQNQGVQPDLYKNQGEIVKIFVSRDVDFSTVYALKSKEH